MADIEKIKVKGTDYTVVDSTVPSHVRTITQQNITDWGSKQDALTAGDGIAIDSEDTIRTTGIPFGVVDSTSTSTNFKITVAGIYKLEDGVCFMAKNGVVTSAANFVINVNGLGGKPCYTNLAAATRDTTIFNANYTMMFVYDSTRVAGGCWICYRGYDSDKNTDTIGYQLRTNSSVLPVSDTARYYKLYFTSADGTKRVPASVNSTNNATSARPVNQRPIDPFGQILYTSANTNYTAGTNLAAATAWSQYAFSLGYSFNRTGAALVLTYPAPVYVKCAPQSNGSAIIDADTPYVQALPTTNDGKIYIFLGIAYNATNVELYNNHPVYYHDGTGIKLWTGSTGGGGSIDTSSFVKKSVSSVTHAVKIGEASGEEITAIKLRSGIADRDEFNDGTIEFSDGVNSGIMLHAYNENFYIEGTGAGELGDSTSYRFPSGVTGDVAVTKNYYTKT